MPKFDGIEVMKYIKEIKQNPKVLIISSDTSLETINRAYQNGCIDYLKKPFFVDELIHKLNILTKEEQNLEITKDLAFNLHASELIYKNESIYLTNKENALLKLLTKNKNQIVTKDQILFEVFDNAEIKENSIRSLIRRLRNKFPIKEVIKTISKNGYSLKYNFK